VLGRQKHILADPAGRYDAGLQQWQYDVPATEYERPGLVKRRDHADGTVVCQAVEHGQTAQEREKCGAGGQRV
jgi:hypothetical protein